MELNNTTTGFSTKSNTIKMVQLNFKLEFYPDPESGRVFENVLAVVNSYKVIRSVTDRRRIVIINWSVWAKGTGEVPKEPVCTDIITLMIKDRDTEISDSYIYEKISELFDVQL